MILCSRLGLRKLHKRGCSGKGLFFCRMAGLLTEEERSAVPRSGRIDHQSTRRCCAVLISLRSGKNKDMLVALVFVHGKTTLHTKPDQGRRRTGSSISVEPINIHAVAKRLPRNRIGILGNLKQIL